MSLENGWTGFLPFFRALVADPCSEQATFNGEQATYSRTRVSDGLTVEMVITSGEFARQEFEAQRFEPAGEWRLPLGERFRLYAVANKQTKVLKAHIAVMRTRHYGGCSGGEGSTDYFEYAPRAPFITELEKVDADPKRWVDYRVKLGNATVSLMNHKRGTRVFFAERLEEALDTGYRHGIKLETALTLDTDLRKLNEIVGRERLEYCAQFEDRAELRELINYRRSLA
jgi:hypothetical protein